jgi:hypothetical protein
MEVPNVHGGDPHAVNADAHDAVSTEEMGRLPYEGD